jgi:hypothetical protein
VFFLFLEGFCFGLMGIKLLQWVNGADGLGRPLGELESEAPLLFDRVLDGLHVVRPREGVGSVGVVDGVVGRYGEGNAVGGLEW